MPLANDKIKLVQVAKRQLRLTDDDYRAILEMVAGVVSSRDLDDDGFGRVMDHFNRLGFQSTSDRRNFGNRTGMASAGQVNLIRCLWSEYTDGTGTDASLGKWLDRQFKVSALRFVTTDMAPKVISALKAMKSKKKVGAAAVH